MSELAKTPLYDEHVALGGKIVPFAGFAMPVQYPAGALKEYHAVRADDGGGLFDISHMGQIRVRGAQALDFLQYVTSNDVARLVDGQVQYAALLNDDGTFIDDITTYRLAEDHYYLCVNAANRHKDVAHLKAQAAHFDVHIEDESERTTLLALQGARAASILAPWVNIDLGAIGYYRFATADIEGRKVMISRTGYTGEDGFELYLPNALAVSCWRALLARGAAPIGLAARDMLRTEMGYALYGHEISDAVTPVEAGLMWITKLDKGAFIGRDAVAARLAQGPRQRLIGLRLTERGIPREHYRVLAEGRPVGSVTSGMFSPLLGTGVALAYVDSEHLAADNLCVEIRNRAIPAERVRPPFVRSRVKKG
ncbi:MAG: glycine cleavage system aminomethyltransferase GcvT [Zetaproteobacteria bacterium]|nr:MAG: glycine cleavage system aminomethyltransferase GcvT [Zetaproteobacteria bacterium]